METNDRALTIEQAAELCGCAPGALRRLVTLGLLPDDGPRLADVNGIRLMLGLEEAGIDLADLAAAVASGAVAAAFGRRLMPEPRALSPRRYAEVLAEAGIPAERATRLFIAAGLPPPEPGRLAREDDIALIGLIARVEALGVSEEALARTLRVLGSATRRITEAMRDFFRGEVEARLAAGPDTGAGRMAAAAELRVPLQRIGREAMLLLYGRFQEDAVFENVTARIQEALAATGYAPRRRPADPAVVFVDLAGYAELTREVGDQAAAATAAAFEARAQAVVAAHGGRIVKALGDGLLILFRDPAGAADGCLDLIERLAADGLPLVHAGLAVGSVLSRDGDIFGHTVNLAARLSGYAAESQVVADETTVSLLGAEPHRWTSLGPVAPKGLPQMTIFALGAPRGTGPVRLGR